MAYIKIVYQNSPSTATPLNAENLNHMDDQIALNDQRLTELEGAHVSSFNGRTGAVAPADNDYNIGQIAPLTGAQVGQVPVVTNIGTEEDPELVFRMGAGGGGGHSIIDSEGNTMPQETAMQFPDSHVSDDEINGRTIVENVKELTLAELSQATERGMYLATDEESVPIPPTEEDVVSVTADGTKTYEQLLNELYAKIDTTKLSDTSCIYLLTDSGNTHIQQLRTKRASNTIFEFVSPILESVGHLYVHSLTVQQSGSKYVSVDISSSASHTDMSSTIPTSAKFSLYYGTSSGIVELNTEVSYSTAERKIGKWIDGSDLYEKTVDFGALPNATNKQVNHGIDNLGTMVEIKGIAIRSSDNASKPLPYSDPTATKIISLETTSSVIYTETGTNYSAYNAWVTLRYTKA